MRQPLFEEIWFDDKWFAYNRVNHAPNSRRYYKIRSIARFALWIPLSYLSFLMIIFVLGLGAGAWN